MSATVIVTGNLTDDPISRTTAQGYFVANFAMASTTRYRAHSGEWVDGATTYYKVTCWRGKGERAAQCLRKGDAVVVYGKSEQKEWTDRNGQIRTDNVIEALAFGPDLARVAAAVVRKTAASPATSPDTSPDTSPASEDDPWAADRDGGGREGSDASRPAA